MKKQIERDLKVACLDCNLSKKDNIWINDKLKFSYDRDNRKIK